MGNLCWPFHKIGKGHPKVMIYIKFVELLFLMLHDKFQNHRPSGSGEENFYINFHSPLLRKLHMTFGFDWPKVSEKKIFEYYGNIQVNCPAVGADLHLGSISFRIINFLSVCPFPSSFFLQMTL